MRNTQADILMKIMGTSDLKNNSEHLKYFKLSICNDNYR